MNGFEVGLEVRLTQSKGSPAVLDWWWMHLLHGHQAKVVAYKHRSNWTISTGNCLKETACTAKWQLALIQQSIISLNSTVYLSQSHLFHMFFNWRIRSLQLPLLNIPHCDILMFHPCPRWDELPVCTPLCNVDSLRHQSGMRILQALTVKRQFYTLQRYSQLSRQLLGDDSGKYILDESLYGHYLKGVILYHPLNLKFLQGGQP